MLWDNMKISDGLEVLDIQGNMFGNVGVFHPTLIWDEDEVVLIDTGLPGQSNLIKEAVLQAGVSFDKLRKIIITHQDTDHLGGLAVMVKENNSIEVLAHEAERPYIEGELTPIKITPERKAKIEMMLSKFPEEKRNEIKEMYTNITAKVDKIIEDGEELPLCGGIEVIFTPGHTPGHICLYLKKYKALVTGDALNVFDGKLCGPNPEFTYNMDEALKSLKKLLKYDIEHVICYHGGIYSDNANERIRELLREVE